MSIVVMAVIAAAAMYVINLFSEVEKNVVKDNRKASYRHLVGSVKSALFTGNNCTSMLGLPINFTAGMLPSGPLPVTNYFPPNPSNFGTSVTLDYNYGQLPGPIKFYVDPAKRFTIPGGTSIYDVKIRLDPDRPLPLRINVQRDILGAPKLIAAWALITLIPDHPGLFLWRADKDAHLQIRTLVYYQPGPTPVLLACFDPTGPAAVCTAQGGTYNDDPSVVDPDLRCEPDQYCFTHKMGIQSTTIYCPPPYNSFGVGSGKYICQWCPKNPKI